MRSNIEVLYRVKNELRRRDICTRVVDSSSTPGFKQPFPYISVQPLNQQQFNVITEIAERYQLSWKRDSELCGEFQLTLD